MNLFKKKMFYILLIVFILVVIFVFNAISSYKNKNKIVATSVSISTSENQKSRNTVPVTVFKVVKSDVDIYKRTLGNVFNLNNVNVSAEASGKLKSVNFEVGDKVKAGDILAIVDDKTLNNNVVSKQTDINTLKVKIADKNKTLQRNKVLHKDGYVSDSDLEALEVELSSLKDNLITAETALKNAKIDLDKAKLIAPITGIIQSKKLGEGNFVSVGTAVFEIIDNSQLVVISSFPEYEYDVFKVGQEAIIHSSSIKDPVKSSVKEIKPVIDEKSRSMQMIIEVENKYNLKPGSVATVNVLVETKKDVIFIPVEAVVQRYNGSVAYVLDGNQNKVVERTLELGVRKDNNIEVIKGLQAGDMLVIDGAGFLVNGSLVNVVS